MKIGEKIRKVREDLDISQCEIASQIPMNQSNYSKIERDLQEPNLDQLRRICEILHLNCQELLGITPSCNQSITESDRILLEDIKALIQKHQKLSR